MRTRIVVDDELMQLVLQITGARTKREAVELGLRAIWRLQMHSQKVIRRFRGKLKWEGDLSAMRGDN